jgi:hypothetical protein
MTDKLLSKAVQPHDTPRCVFTGAEKFLEIAEEIDQENTGLLHEDGKPWSAKRYYLLSKHA